MKVNSILETIGNTPHLKINRLFSSEYSVWVKLERANPGASIKDRTALSMVNDAEKKGILKQGSVIIEPTSGNTGIGLALVAAVKGYKLILVMPESMSIERRKIMNAYGAEFVLTPRERGMEGAIARSRELLSEIPGSWTPMQFDNPANTEIHKETTAREIINDFPDGIDYLISGVGTGGHLTGCAITLKKHFPKLKVFAVEPDLSPVISGGKPSPHSLQGLGAGFIPSILDTKILDGVIKISRDDAYNFTKRAAKEEGLFVGISSGASLAAINQKIDEFPKGSRIMTFSYDTGERYISVDGLF
jgi:cysteine synthase